MTSSWCAALLNDARKQLQASDTNKAPVGDYHELYIGIDSKVGLPCTSGHDDNDDSNNGGSLDKSDEYDTNDETDDKHDEDEERVGDAAGKGFTDKREGRARGRAGG